MPQYTLWIGLSYVNSRYPKQLEIFEYFKFWIYINPPMAKGRGGCNPPKGFSSFSR